MLNSSEYDFLPYRVLYFLAGFSEFAILSGVVVAIIFSGKFLRVEEQKLSVTQILGAKMSEKEFLIRRIFLLSFGVLL